MDWFGVSLLAVLGQSLRNAISKKLSGDIGAEAVTFCRFLCAIPFVGVGFLVCREYFGDIRIIDSEFFLWILALSITQIISNLLLIYLFHQKNFAVAIALCETITIFTAIFGWLVLSERLSIFGSIGILTAFIGFGLITATRAKFTIKNFIQGFGKKSAVFGLLSGFCGAIAIVCIKKRGLD